MTQETSFFEVPFVCRAAPHLGCGSLAKPILSRIEKLESVREAWLNRQGTLLAVVRATGCENRIHEHVLSLLRNAGFNSATLEGGRLDEALAAFHPRRGWYRATQIDSLSHEEAEVIAARLVRRLGERAVLRADKANQLRGAIRSACARILTDAVETSVAERSAHIAVALPRVARGFLDDASQAAFEEVVALGHRPLPGET